MPIICNRCHNLSPPARFRDYRTADGRIEKKNPCQDCLNGRSRARRKNVILKLLKNIDSSPPTSVTTNLIR